MKQRLASILLPIGAFLAALTGSITAAGEETQTSLVTVQITPAMIEGKIAEVKANSNIEEDAKATLLEIYQEISGNLQTATKYRDAAQDFRTAAQKAPLQARKLRDETDEAGTAANRPALGIDQSASLRQIEQMLQKEKAELAAARARQADLEQQLNEEKENRPALMQSRLTEAKEQQSEVAGQLELPPLADEGPATAEARQWLSQTRYQMLTTEIEMLDQELLSQPARVELLEAERVVAAASAERAAKRVADLVDLVTRKRQHEADQAKADAEATRREAEGKHPLVVELADRNATLSQEVAAMASRLDERATQAEQADKLAGRIEDDFKSATETIEIGGLSQELGQMLLQQRQSLPDIGFLRRQTDEREQRAAEVGVKRLRYRQEQKHLRDPAAWVAETLAQVDAAEATPVLRKQLRELAEERRTLLEQAVESSDFQLRRLGELERAQQRLLSAIEDYDAFLSENLLWIRSASPTELEELGALPEQVWRILSPSGWLGVAGVLGYEATHSPVFVLLALALGVLLWSRRRLISIILATSANLGKPTTDRFGFSLQALGLTLVAASAWPLVMAVTGWQLGASAKATDFSSAVGSSLLATAAQFFFLRTLYLVCMPGGLAAAHFRWRAASLVLLRKEVIRLSWIYLPAAMVTVVAFYLDPLNVGWLVGRSAFLIMVASLAFAFYRLLHPTSGALSDYLHRPERETFRRLHRIWYPILVAAPLALGLLSLMGYVYTAGTLLALLIRTAWMILGLTILRALTRRWLLVTRRRLAYEAAMARRQEAEKAKQAADQGLEAVPSGVAEVEEPRIDLLALTDTSRKLLNTAVVVLGLVGLWLIWSEVLPALHILDEVTLWRQAVTVGGEDQIQPVTLADIGLAILYTVATFILAKQLPSVLEMILLKRVGITSGARYTITTLTTYAVVAVGILLVLNTIGAQWSKLQWLVAALGVGIGFGLQEIVANFISGIIILAERPVRVGDIVTVGDTDGIVTRIRIRATSIRNWNRQELLVPNKELVTGKVLNWCLTDRTTRVEVVVGVAYGSDVDKALELMREAAVEHEHVLADPAPLLSFEGFGDNSLKLVLRAYLGSLDYKLSTITDLHKAINRKLEAAGIVIAFPQRDLHLDTAEALRVRIEDNRGADSQGGAAG